MTAFDGQTRDFGRQCVYHLVIVDHAPFSDR